MIIVPLRDCRGSTPTWKRSSALRAWHSFGGFPPFSGWAAGSAATATAIGLLPRAYCAPYCGPKAGALLPGSYGFGSAVGAWLQLQPNGGMQMLQAMCREWRFFQMLLSNMDMLLAKSDIAIASRYAELVCDAELPDCVFSRLRAEWQNTVDALLTIMDQRSQQRVRQSKPYSAPL